MQHVHPHSHSIPASAKGTAIAVYDCPYKKTRLTETNVAPQPEQQAREKIDQLLSAAGWLVCDAAAANIHAARGVAIREFPLPGHGFADYLLYVDGKAADVIEAKKEGAPEFLALTLHSESYRNRFFVRETGNVGQGNVGLAAVTIEAVPVAPLAEQQRIVAEVDRRLSLLSETGIQVVANHQRAERLRQVILAKAFCGGFNVNNVVVSINARQSNGGRVR